MGPAPLPGGSDRSPGGTEGTEGFAALLAGVMVAPPPRPAPAATTLPGGDATPLEGAVLDGGDSPTQAGGNDLAAADGQDEAAPVDPRALLLRAGIRTGDAPRAPRGTAFPPGTVSPAEPTGTRAPASPASPGEATAGTRAPDAASTGATGSRPPATPDVMGATGGQGWTPSGAEAPVADPADRALGQAGAPSERSAAEAPRSAGEPTAPSRESRAFTPVQAPSRPLPSLGGPALPTAEVPTVEVGVGGRAGEELRALEHLALRSGSDDLALPVDRTVARALAAAGLDPADFPALQGSALSAAVSEAEAGGPTLPVTAADRSMARLDPDFRVRLERVVERLQTEHGIEARFLEGFRPQLRQEHLYAQGRTAPGPVVTWTRNSMHTQGRAADLKLEGGAESYRILHQVAAEEGLRTLGMKDPGHVELPRSQGSGAGTGASTLTAPAEPGSAPVAGPLPGPQGVARVARVARVATPARPGVTPTALRTAPGTDGGDPVPRTARKGETGTETAVAQGGESAEFRSDLRSPVPLPEVGLAGVRAPVGPGAGMAALDRVAELEELRESAPLGPMRRIDLRDADGQGTRVRIEMKGDVVQTEIRTPDGELARVLEPASRELEGALERHGLELGRLKVGRSAEALAPRDFIHPTVAEPSRGQSGGEDSARQGQQRSPRDGEGAHDHPRHRNPSGNPDREYQP